MSAGRGTDSSTVWDVSTAQSWVTDTGSADPIRRTPQGDSSFPISGGTPAESFSFGGGAPAIEFTFGGDKQVPPTVPLKKQPPGSNIIDNAWKNLPKK